MRTLRSLLVSMQRALARARRRMALGAVTAALGLLGTVGTGCEATEEAKNYYGPAPVDDVADQWATDLYGVMDYGVDNSVPPPPEEVVENWATDVYGCLEDFDEPEEIAPPPDGVQEAVPDVTPDGVQVLYGPPPVDVVQETVPDVQPDCPPMAYYGPPPCTSDAECQADHGATWYCDQTNVFPDGCGGTVPYPQCKPKE